MKKIAHILQGEHRGLDVYVVREYYCGGNKIVAIDYMVWGCLWTAFPGQFEIVL